MLKPTTSIVTKTTSSAAPAGPNPSKSVVLLGGTDQLSDGSIFQLGTKEDPVQVVFGFGKFDQGSTVRTMKIRVPDDARQYFESHNNANPKTKPIGADFKEDFQVNIRVDLSKAGLVDEESGVLADWATLGFPDRLLLILRSIRYDRDGTVGYSLRAIAGKRLPREGTDSRLRPEDAMDFAFC